MGSLKKCSGFFIPKVPFLGLLSNNYSKNLTDFRKTMETGVDLPLLLNRSFVYTLGRNLMHTLRMVGWECAT